MDTNCKGVWLGLQDFANAQKTHPSKNPVVVVIKSIYGSGASLFGNIGQSRIYENTNEQRVEQRVLARGGGARTHAKRARRESGWKVRMSPIQWGGPTGR